MWVCTHTHTQTHTHKHTHTNTASLFFSAGVCGACVCVRAPVAVSATNTRGCVARILLLLFGEARGVVCVASSALARTSDSASARMSARISVLAAAGNPQKPASAGFSGLDTAARTASCCGCCVRRRSVAGVALSSSLLQRSLSFFPDRHSLRFVAAPSRIRGLVGKRQRWGERERKEKVSDWLGAGRNEATSEGKKNRQKWPHNACIRETGGHISWM